MRFIDYSVLVLTVFGPRCISERSLLLLLLLLLQGGYGCVTRRSVERDASRATVASLRCRANAGHKSRVSSCCIAVRAFHSSDIDLRRQYSTAHASILHLRSYRLTVRIRLGLQLKKAGQR